MVGNLQAKIKLKGFLFFVVLNAIILYFQLEESWPLIQSTGLRAPGYVDMYSVLLSGTCSITGYFPWENLAGHCNTYWYGNALLIVSKFIDFSVSWATPISLFLILLTVFTLIFLLDTHVLNYKNVIYSTLIIWSPPVQLLFERGNLDLVMFILLVFAAYFASKDKFLSSTIFIGIATLVKFYTVPLLWLIIFLNKRNKFFTLQLIFSVLVTFDVIVEYARLTSFNLAIPYDGIAQFGSSELELYFSLIDVKLPETVWIIIGNFIMLVSAVLIYFARSNGKFKVVRSSTKELGFRGIVAVFSGITFLFCYVSGKNYDYRLIYLVSFILTFKYLVEINKNLDFAWKTLAALSLWLTFSSYSLSGIVPGYLIVFLQLVGDMLTGLIASIFLVLFLEFFKKGNLPDEPCENVSIKSCKQ